MAKWGEAFLSSDGEPIVLNKAFTIYTLTDSLQENSYDLGINQPSWLPSRCKPCTWCAEYLLSNSLWLWIQLLRSSKSMASWFLPLKWTSYNVTVFVQLCRKLFGLVDSSLADSIHWDNDLMVKWHQTTPAAYVNYIFGAQLSVGWAGGCLWDTVHGVTMVGHQVYVNAGLPLWNAIANGILA